MSDRKISQLDSISMNLSSNGQLTPSVLFVPAFTRNGSNTTSNGAVNLATLVSLIYNRIVEWAQQAISTGEYEEPSAPSGGGEVSLSAFNALKSRVTALENGSSGGGGSINVGSFPTHTIQVITQNGTTSYSLPCAPDSDNETVIINVVSGDALFTVSLTVSNVNITGSSITTAVTATVSKSGGAGGTLSSIKVSGSFICGSGGGSGYFTEQEMISSSYTVTGSQTHSTTVTGTGATGSSATVYITVKVNNKAANQTTITNSTGNTAQGTIYVTA